MTIFPRESLVWVEHTNKLQTFEWLELDAKVIETWRYFKSLIRDMNF